MLNDTVSPRAVGLDAVSEMVLYTCDIACTVDDPGVVVYAGAGGRGADISSIVLCTIVRRLSPYFVDKQDNLAATGLHGYIVYAADSAPTISISPLPPLMQKANP